MDAFSSGPFSFEPSDRAVAVAGAASRRWTLRYGLQELAERTLPVELTRDAVCEAFAESLAAFRSRAMSEHAPDRLLLIDYETGDAVATLDVASDPGLKPALIDDRSRYWLRSSDRMRSLDVSLTQFAEIATAHAAPALHWVAGLLPGDVLTTDAEEWCPPTAWEIRHVVGEGSFTGLSGARAAALVGVAPQNFRKYTAGEGAKHQQRMSFAMWHLLLQRMGVQRA